MSPRTASSMVSLGCRSPAVMTIRHDLALSPPGATAWAPEATVETRRAAPVRPDEGQSGGTGARLFGGGEVTQRRRSPHVRLRFRMRSGARSTEPRGGPPGPPICVPMGGCSRCAGLRPPAVPAYPGPRIRGSFLRRRRTLRRSPRRAHTAWRASRAVAAKRCPARRARGSRPPGTRQGTRGPIGADHARRS